MSYSICVSVAWARSLVGAGGILASIVGDANLLSPQTSINLPLEEEEEEGIFKANAVNEEAAIGVMATHQSQD